MCFLSFFISQCNFLAWLWFHLLHTLREGGLKMSGVKAEGWGGIKLTGGGVTSKTSLGKRTKSGGKLQTLFGGKRLLDWSLAASWTHFVTQQTLSGLVKMTFSFFSCEDAAAHGLTGTETFSCSSWPFELFPHFWVLRGGAGVLWAFILKCCF